MHRHISHNLSFWVQFIPTGQLRSQSHPQSGGKSGFTVGGITIGGSIGSTAGGTKGIFVGVGEMDSDFGWDVGSTLAGGAFVGFGVGIPVGMLVGVAGFFAASLLTPSTSVCWICFISAFAAGLFSGRTGIIRSIATEPARSIIILINFFLIILSCLHYIRPTLFVNITLRQLNV